MSVHGWGGVGGGGGVGDASIMVKGHFTSSYTEPLFPSGIVNTHEGEGENLESWCFRFDRFLELE